MVIRKYFALSIVAASLTLAGCSSDDDDDTDTTTGGDTTGDTGGDTTGDTGGDTTGDTGGDTTGDTGGDGGEPVTDMSTMTGNSVLDLARGTDEDGDGEIDADSGVADLSELVTALGNYPRLLNALDDEGTAYTVFAPNNDAFPDGATADDALENTLSYHVVSGQAFNTQAVEAGTEFPLMLETVQGGTIEVVEVDGGGYAIVDSADNEVAIGEPTLTAGEAPSAVYVIDQVLTAPEAMEPGGEDGADGEDGGTEDGGTDGGGAATAGSALAAIQADSNLSSFEALVESSNRGEALQATDDPNRAQVVFAPTNSAIDPSVTSAVAYTYTGRTSGTGPLDPGSYSGTGEEALTFELAGSGEDITVNGLEATFVETTSGPALYVFGD